MDPESHPVNPHPNFNEDQMDLKHADSNNSIPPPPPPITTPIPPVATMESDGLYTPDEDVQNGMKPGLEDEDPGAVAVPPADAGGVVVGGGGGVSEGGDEHHQGYAPGMEEVPPHHQDYDVSHEQQQEKTVAVVEVEEKEVRGENCCERILRCLSYVPCGSLVAWILLLLGLGALSGSAIIGARKTRVLLEEDALLWFLEYTVTGVAVSMFVLGSLFLVAGHLSTDPTSRRLFNSSSKNRCARGFNIFLLVFIYILCLCWILLCILLATPVVMLVMMYLVTDDMDCLQLKNYGFDERNICGDELDSFKEKAQDVLICFGVTLLSAFFVVISLVHFLICVSANITHLRDNRFATLNAYETEELRNSKHSVLQDTNM